MLWNACLDLSNRLAARTFFNLWSEFAIGGHCGYGVHGRFGNRESCRREALRTISSPRGSDLWDRGTGRGRLRLVLPAHLSMGGNSHSGRESSFRDSLQPSIAPFSDDPYGRHASSPRGAPRSAHQAGWRFGFHPVFCEYVWFGDRLLSMRDFSSARI